MAKTTKYGTNAGAADRESDAEDSPKGYGGGYGSNPPNRAGSQIAGGQGTESVSKGGRSERAAPPLARGNRPMGGRGAQDASSGRDATRSDVAGRAGGRAPTSSVSMSGVSENTIVRTCASILNETISYCLDQGEKFADARTLKAFIDASELVTVYSNIAARGSDQAEPLRPIVAQAVKEAEEYAEEFSDDETLTALADVCRETCETLGLATATEEE